MLESEYSSVELQWTLLMSDSDMAAAAQQLMLLSDEDNSSSTSSSNGNNNKKQKIKVKMMKDERCLEQSQNEITSAKIEEIFGKEEISRPTKKRRYRFLESIYKETKSMKGKGCFSR
ncbi:hypothetical protein E1A91_A02G154700v1 [Gossypium mustelinum]|uniref:Uncharacterized protein n=1 Tax=Gossypium mustelinum TaxID=34275 RepID=A0A5D3ABQ7_GOSMU|nr:uncharacterized protein LOC108466857 [Gossypium arboreum]TYJ46946.1 hypothetical protein E1A91_A02G154700v1 [Gossypium mustelinum]